jgi:pantoate--beta-alanine ligase
MVILRTVSELEIFLENFRKEGNSVGFVPTMGALHEGHLSLIRKAQMENECTLLSIFVNPTQFNETSDFKTYPRNEEKDLALIESLAIDAVFIPPSNEMYADDKNDLLDFSLEGLDLVMEGRFRKGHFDGVVTIVDKFFSLIKPNVAYFGLKDFQQLAIIRFLASRRHPSIRIAACPIIREVDGLAMSSRNALLNNDERQRATLISKVLGKLKENWRVLPFNELINQARLSFEGTDFTLDYLEISDSETLRPLFDYTERSAVVCVAAKIGAVRLIDNCELTN